MKALLESKDLLSEKRVMAAAKSLGVNLWQSIGGQTQTVLHKSLEEVAFQMRDVTLEYNWKRSLQDVIHYVNFHLLKTTRITTDEATAKMWIWASVLAFEAADAAGDDNE